MKNLVLLLLLVLSVVSCEDIETNEFAMQAKINNRLYTSTEARGSISDDGGFIIQGATQSESLTIRLSQLKEGIFDITGGSSNYATFEDMDGNLYKTKPNGQGSVTISEVNETNKTLSGIFNFTAMLPGIDTIYVSQGVLYNIPYSGGNTDLPGEAGTFSAKVNGEPFVPTVVSATETGASIMISGSTIAESILITIPSNVETGEYQLPEDGYNAFYQNESGIQPVTTGTITIAEHNLVSGSIKGTFSFLTEESEITEGQFDVIY